MADFKALGVRFSGVRMRFVNDPGGLGHLTWLGEGPILKVEVLL
jgi:hypothetical protein